MSYSLWLANADYISLEFLPSSMSATGNSAVKREISAVRGQKFDVLIVGGGAFAACAAWEAVLCGYSVALIEARDFGSGTSANSYKMVH